MQGKVQRIRPDVNPDWIEKQKAREAKKEALAQKKAEKVAMQKAKDSNVQKFAQVDAIE